MRVRLRKGDTFWYYSQLFQLPINLIIDSNPGLSPQTIQPGTTIEIPGFLTTQKRINRGESLWQVARERGISIDALILLNQEVNSNTLETGQIILIPIRVTWFVVETNRDYDYSSLNDDINRLLTVYPFVRSRSIGSSVMGKQIPELRVGRGNKRIHANASFHANEWITTPVLVRFLNECLLALTNNRAIRGLVMGPYYENSMLSLVPMVNPDGVDLVINGAPRAEPYRTSVLSINQGSTDFSGWKSNIRGVDLNDQFPAYWEREAATKRKQPAPRDYPGTAPLSEPEAIAMAALTRESDFLRVLAFHTQGKVIYWGFENLEPPESRRLANEFERVSGYDSIRSAESYAGYKDWFIMAWRRPGFTIELGRGVNPLPLSQFEEIYQESLGILLASIYL